jgi:hypothetical protein
MKKPCGTKKMAKGGMVRKMAKGGLMCSPRKKMAMGMKKGGVVKKYAEGGMVEDDREYMKVARPTYDNSATAYMSTPETRKRSRELKNSPSITKSPLKHVRDASEEVWEDIGASERGGQVGRLMRQGNSAAAKRVLREELGLKDKSR